MGGTPHMGGVPPMWTALWVAIHLCAEHRHDHVGPHLRACEALVTQIPQACCKGNGSGLRSLTSPARTPHD